LENDVEVFIDGGDCYYEFEINALGTIYEVFFIWQDAYLKGKFNELPEFDLVKNEVDILGGFQDYRYKKHPRGKRWAFMNWDFAGLLSAVSLQGTLNDNTDTDDGWTVELAFPWKGMKHLAGKRSLPPKDGDVWRMDFSRFEKICVDGKEVQPHPGSTAVYRFLFRIYQTSTFSLS
ncbi:MAG: carbohydrate-binding family 9-like protein, partial [Candidatus Kariarchaeaceae archaeon]